MTRNSSRNLQLMESDDNTFWQVVKRLKLNELLTNIGRNVAIQGELMGPGIQGNRESLLEHDIFIFNIFDIDRQEYMSYDERGVFIAAMNVMGPTVFKQCPILGIHTLSEFTTLQYILAFADGQSLNHRVREGVVFKRTDGLFSFKVISNAFLLAEK